MSTALEIERIVRCAAMSLADSLYFYWPANGMNDICEKNISLHLASAFIKRGYFIYGEAHAEREANLHLDLLAIDPATNTLVTTECKRLYSLEKAREMVADVHRLRAWRVSEERFRRSRKLERRFGVLAATTWERDYAEWFQSDDSIDDPNQGLGELWRELRDTDVHWGAAVLLDSAPVEGLQRTTEWLVYAVFSLPDVYAR